MINVHGEMMKLGIITFHFVNNFGGLLQTYALYHTIHEKIGMEVELIDYRNWFIRFTDTVRLFPITKNRKAFVSGLKSFRQRIERKKRFNAFLHTEFVMSKMYRSSIAMKMNPPKNDKYICGSDQIWNPIITGGVVSAYYLEFVNDSTKTCAYAPSFGTGNIPAFFQKRIKKKLENIGMLSVREKSSKADVKAWTGRGAERLIDPTFLMDATRWRKVEKCNIELPEHYILVYIMQSNYNIYEHVANIRAEFNLPVVDISRYGYNPGCVDDTLIGIGCSEFLHLFDHADIVCTNSYHGLVFSLIFGKRLFLVPSQNFAMRMENLLDLLKIKGFDMSSSNEIRELKYDKDALEDIVKLEREKALSYLRKFIER